MARPPQSSNDSRVLRLGLPKGSMQQGVFSLLEEAGVRIKVGLRGYRPTLSLPDIEAKILKPQNIIEMLHAGSRDIGFAGADWVAELEVDNLIELVDTGLDPVRIVAAAPVESLVEGALPKRHLVVASEYQRLTSDWISRCGLDASLVRSYGATEVFPPEDADCIVDNTATGATLRQNGLEITDELMRSSTRLYANQAALDDPGLRQSIDRFVMLLQSVLEARRRVMLEVNVSAEALESVVAALPSLREPTVAPLHGDAGYAVKAAVPRAELPQVIPEIKARGGTGIVVTRLSQIVP